jgi:hypothetical protein
MVEYLIFVSCFRETKLWSHYNYEFIILVLSLIIV